MQRWDPKTADTRAGPMYLPPSEFVRNLDSAGAEILLILPILPKSSDYSIRRLKIPELQIRC